MSPNSDEKILNAIGLHLIMLNVANEAAQTKLEEIIKQKDSNAESVKLFLINHFNKHKHTSDDLIGFIRTLKKYKGKTSSFPNNLKDFDVSACYSIARNFLALPSSDLKIYECI
jgi:hypothetical protein